MQRGGPVFCTQQPADIPRPLSGSWAIAFSMPCTFTPMIQKQLKALVDGFRTHPTLDLQAVIPALKVGEALVSVLDENGQPTIPAQTMMAPADQPNWPPGETERHEIIRQSRFYGRFEERIDRTSAHGGKARLQNPEKSEKSQQPQRAVRPTHPVVANRDRRPF
ncbi:MAG: helicase HerA-like domain-containing protein [Vampirovibrionales bacterium]